MSYKTEPLKPGHDRTPFDCGIEVLNNYLKKQANQDQKRKLSVCFVYHKKNKVLAYYTLSNNSLQKSIFPQNISKKWPPNYNTIPTTLIGRFAVDQNQQGKGIGKLLLVDALKRSYEISKIIGSVAVCIDPKDDNSKAFYQKLGFTLLPNSGKMILPMKTIAKLF